MHFNFTTPKGHKGRDSQFGACLYYLFACAPFLARAQLFFVYELIVSKLPNFACK